jgi:hypothetical protein
MFVRRLVAVLLVLGFLAGFSVPASGQDKDKDKDKGKSDKVKLAWKFVKDKVFYQKMTTDTKQTMKVMNNDVAQTQKQTFYFSWKTTKVEGKAVTIEQKIEGVAMDIDIGGSKISYDSTKDTTANNPLGDFFKALVGSTFTLELDLADLKVTKIEGRDDFLKKLVAANPQMKPLLETILSESALKEMSEPTFAVIQQGKEVSKGDKWTKKTSLDMGPIGKYDNTYDYSYAGPDEKDKNLHIIKVVTTLNYKEPAETAGQGGLPFRIKGAKLKSASPSGTIEFDNAKGRVKRSMMKLELKGELSIEIGGQTTKVELSQTQESTVETLDENPLKKK